MAIHAPVLHADPASVLRVATTAGWLAVLFATSVDLWASADGSRPAQIGGTVAAVAAVFMVCALVTRGPAAWQWYRRGVFVAATVMAGRAVAVGVIYGWGFDAFLSASLAILAGGLWLGTRTYSHPGG